MTVTIKIGSDGYSPRKAVMSKGTSVEGVRKQASSQTQQQCGCGRVEGSLGGDKRVLLDVAGS